MRRLLLPILLLAVAIGATVQMNRANEEADPGRAVGVSTEVDLATPIFSARRAPEWLRNPKSDTMLVDAINRVLRTDETPPLSCVLVERDGERMAASNTAAAIRTDELHASLRPRSSTQPAAGERSAPRSPSPSMPKSSSPTRKPAPPNSRVMSGSSVRATLASPRPTTPPASTMDGSSPTSTSSPPTPSPNSRLATS